ncbi:MAG: Gfo/Idh/MocA family oxidoreductase [Clostridiales bacterium]|jgi:predicted dehydrogenase|nr:Gfo/Idh/MocA family oxidoreductase [Clostridiales bacterium]
MAKKLRIGIIGTGGIAHAHANAYKNFKDVEIVAGADIIPGKARAFLDEFNLAKADAYESCEELCARKDIDAVSVCTYNTQHAVCTIAALESGKHVLLEKPMTLTLDEAKAVMAAEKKSGKIVSIGFQPRYGANFRLVHDLIAAGTLGDVYYVQTGGGRRRGIPGRTFIDRDKAGVGALGDIGCYALDFALNSIGYPKPLTVSAVAYDYFGKNPKYYGESERFSVDDFSAAFVRLEGGITLDFRMSWAMHMDTTGDFLFLGKDAGLKVRQPHYELWGGAWDGTVGDITLYHDVFGKPTATPIPIEKQEKGNLFESKVRAFVDAVLTGGKAPIPTSQIIYNQAIIDGIVRSAACGHEVEIAL